MTAIDGDGPFHPDAMEALEYAQAGELLRKVLERSFGPDVAGTDDFRVLIAAARARSMQALRVAPHGSGKKCHIGAGDRRGDGDERGNR
jgi:hypothetical protein